MENEIKKPRTVNLNKELVIEAKIQAAKLDMSLKGYIERAIKKQLELDKTQIPAA